MIMNHVRFMFSEISNFSILYERRKSNSSEFSSDEIVIDEIIDHTEEYCQNIIDDIKEKISFINETAYKGCLDRIGNEVFLIHCDSANYTVSFTIDTFQEKNIRIQVDILPEYKTEDISKCYDSILESLKIELKNCLKKDWKYCIWLIDEPSEFLCEELYSYFFEKENEIRSFVNRVLIHHLGAEWIRYSGLEKYYESAKKRADDFIQKVPELDDINTDLLSLTLESIFGIVFKGEVFEEGLKLSRNELLVFENMLKNNVNYENIQSFILKHKIKKANIWDDIFSQYFATPDKFKTDINKFISSRNHIAHNKLITWNAYTTILKELNDIEIQMDYAEMEFNRREPSEELIMSQYIENEIAVQQEEFINSIVKEETGINVLNEDEILNKFSKTMYKIYLLIMKEFHFDPCFEIGDYKDLKVGQNDNIFCIKNNLDNKSEVIINAIVYIDAGMGKSSEMKIYCNKDIKELFQATATFVNGQYQMNNYEVTDACDSVYYDEEINEFSINLIEFIKNNLNT